MRKLIVILSFISLSICGFSQDNGYTGGFQFKTMLLSNYFNGGTQVENLDSVTISSRSKFGYVFGMTIRKKFTDALAIESGLRFVQRNYSNTIDSTTSAYNEDLTFRIIGYEIPLKALVTLRASTNSYFSVAFGGQLDFYPSDVFASDGNWQIETVRKSWIQGSFLANVGWEIHPEKKGTFYVGFSYNQPFTDPFVAKIGKFGAPFSETNLALNGIYLSLDFRYYFETKKAKK